MLSRIDVLSKAADDCMRELYTLVQPAVEWDDFKKQCEEYTTKYHDWEKNRDSNPDWKDKHIDDCIGPRPYEFYYLPKEVMENVVNSYIYAYRITAQEDLLNTISLLKRYCEEPIVSKYIEGHTDEDGFHHPGYRGYDHPDNIVIQISKECNLYEDQAQQCWDKVKEFLDMAGNFYNWNSELNSFNTTVYLGASPNSNKEAVIENWKKYKNVDIEIDESKWNDDDEDF